MGWRGWCGWFRWFWGMQHWGDPVRRRDMQGRWRSTERVCEPNLMRPLPLVWQGQHQYVLRGRRMRVDLRQWVWELRWQAGDRLQHQPQQRPQPLRWLQQQVPHWVQLSGWHLRMQQRYSLQELHSIGHMRSQHVQVFVRRCRGVWRDLQRWRGMQVVYAGVRAMFLQRGRQLRWWRNVLPNPKWLPEPDNRPRQLRRLRAQVCQWAELC